MSTTAVYPAPPSAASSGVSRALRITPKEIRYEFTKLLRTRPFLFGTMGFPIMFYALFGIANRGSYPGGIQIAKYLLGGYACFGLVAAALFGIGAGMANEIAAGWLELKRASPMPVGAYLAAKCTAAAAFGVIIVSTLTMLGVAFAGVSLTAVEFGKMMAVTLAGSVCFASMGLMLALVIPANAAPSIINLIYLPMSFLSGLWIPLRFMPHWLQRIAPFLPTYHLSQLMLSIYGYQDSVSLVTHGNALIGFTLLMFGLAWLLYHRREQSA